MISYKRLPGAAGLGTLGLPDLKAYWNTVKANIANFKQLGYQISLHQQKLGNVKSILMNRNDPNKYIMDDEITKTQDDLDKYWKVQGYIDQYVPQWAQLDDPGAVVTPGSAVSGMGFVPLILGAAAIFALGYVVTVGMSLREEYAFKTQLTQDIIEKKITSGQAAEVLSVPREPGAIEIAVKDVVASVGFGIPTAVLVAGGLYTMYATGLLNTVLGMFKGSSTPSSEA